MTHLTLAGITGPYGRSAPRPDFQTTRSRRPPTPRWARPRSGQWRGPRVRGWGSRGSLRGPRLLFADPRQKRPTRVGLVELLSDGDGRATCRTGGCMGAKGHEACLGCGCRRHGIIPPYGVGARRRSRSTGHQAHRRAERLLGYQVQPPLLREPLIPVRVMLVAVQLVAPAVNTAP